MPDFLNPAFINPTILYLVLLAGLWVAVLAAHMGGTGVLEIVAFVLLAGSLYALTLMPTNWEAFLLMLLGAGCFFVIPYLSPRWGYLAELGLVLQAAGSFFLFDSEKQVSPLIIVAMIVISWLFNRFLLMPVLKSHRTQSAIDKAAEVIGQHGRVVDRIDPLGAVNVNGEIWTARSHAALEVDTEIVVTAKQGLELRVEKAKREHPAEVEVSRV
jgi:membrane-bound serine protease (ClpP class)